jgi:hypothetical protein
MVGYHVLEYIPVETQNFTENKNQNHADVNARLLHICPNTLRSLLELDNSSSRHRESKFLQHHRQSR